MRVDVPDIWPLGGSKNARHTDVITDRRADDRWHLPPTILMPVNAPAFRQGF
jgi:hypothetical protein